MECDTASTNEDLDPSFEVSRGGKQGTESIKERFRVRHYFESPTGLGWHA